MIRALLALILVATPIAAQELSLPTGLQLAAEDVSAADSVRLPTAPYDGTPPPLAEGRIVRRVYSFIGSSLTTLQIVDPVRKGLKEQGYREIFTCADAACGGFDFRFQLDLLPEPEMHVDLGDYRYVLLHNADLSPSDVTLVASRSSSTAFLHITGVYPAETPPSVQTSLDPGEDVQTVSNPTISAATVPSGDLIERLELTGSVTLDDLEFETGSAALGQGDFASLQELAEWLAENPSARVALVGHTDAVGSLGANIALSRRRAQAVAERMTGALGTRSGQLEALGAGYLAPRASNLTEEGRSANRRVEAVLLSRD